MSGSKAPLIEVRDLWKAYGSQQVLKGLSLGVYRGETLVIMGRSGVGKSVLLKQMIGVETPDRGSIRVGGRELAPLESNSPFSKSCRMGMLFQGGALFDSLTIGENTGFYLREHPDPETGLRIKEEELKSRIQEALSWAGLEGTEHKMPSELSGGMRKRAALARLILYRPDILLYDEPTTGLDPITAMQINNLINTIKEKLKATSIVVTHDIKSALSVGDRFAFHHEGKILLTGDKESFLSSKEPLIQMFFKEAILTEELFTH